LSEFTIALPRPVMGIRAVLPKKTHSGRLIRRRPEAKPDHDTVIAELEKVSQERSEAAYKHGIEDGTAMGLEQGRQEIQGAMTQLQAVTEALSAYQGNMTRDVDEVVTQLALAVAKMLIHREVTQDPALVKNVVKEALKQVDDRRRMTIKVHPEDWKTVHGLETEVREAMHGIQELEIKEDSLIRRGGCLIESDSGIVDSRIETQVEEIANGVLGSI